MHRHQRFIWTATAAIFCTLSAQAQVAGVTESTDPARAAAVEKAAQQLKTQRAARTKAGTPAVGPVRGTSGAGIAFVSGGVTADGRGAMYGERTGYSLWVAAVAKPSGAYLVGAQLRIVDAKGQQVLLDHAMDGPWLMARLAPGRYVLSATLARDVTDPPQTVTTQVTITQKGQRQAVLRFPSQVEVLNDPDSPFKGNPFGNPDDRR